MKARTLVYAFAALLVLSAASAAQSKKCTPAGGMLMTDIGVPDANSTMGYAAGDLKGAVGVSILSVQQSGSTLTLNVQHHWVSESGDIISFDPATATATQVAPGVYGIVSYPTHLNGNGTGKFAGVTGDFTNMGEADLINGRIVVRYLGTICSK